MSSIPANFPEGHIVADPDDTFEVGLGPFYTPDNDRDHSVMFVAEQRHINASKVVHGALLMTLADLAICYTARQGYPGERALTVSMNADFVDGGQVGEFIVAKAEVIRRTGSFVFMRTQVIARPPQANAAPQANAEPQADAEPQAKAAPQERAESRVLLNVSGVVKRLKPR
jgi:acyl-coenzyme A thioesterase PaaI-like protein